MVTLDLLQRAQRLSDELTIAEEEAEPAPEPVGMVQTFQARWQKWIHRNDRKLTGNEAILERVGEFVVDAFNNQFTLTQLRSGADFVEIMLAVKAIAARGQAMPKMFPTPPAKKPGKKR